MSKVLLKCGGFSTQLAKNLGFNIDADPLWGSRYDKTHPEIVVQTHMDFLKSGADIILTNTYQSSVEGFMKYLNISREESKNCIRSSVRLTQEAKNKYLHQLLQDNGISTKNSKEPLILGSIGPFGATLHDGSEYTGSYAEMMTPKEMQIWHRSRIDLILEEGVDGLAIETIPCQKESDALTAMLLTSYEQVKFWISFQCKDDLHLAHGECFSDAVFSVWNQVQNAKATERLLGIGVNCVHPKFVSPLFSSLYEKCTKNVNLPPLLVYSNSGDIYNNIKGEWTFNNNNVPLENYVSDWIGLGAKIIGGCCHVYADDVCRLRKFIDNIN